MSVSTVIVVTADAVSSIVMGILIYALLFENSEKDKKTKYFTLCCACSLLSLVTDLSCWVLEGRQGYDTLMYILNTAALITSLGAAGFFAYYESEYISRRSKNIAVSTGIITGICFAAAIFVIISVMCGKCFTVEKGIFYYGPWYRVSYIVCVVLIIFMALIAVANAKVLGFHDTIAFVVYMIFPLLAINIEIHYPEISLSLTAVAVSCLQLYIMLQSGHVSALNMRGEILNEMSYRDMLTGLQNRRCYDEALNRVADEPAINVLFCDVNGLKYTNDTAGHAAGDERLVAFGDILKKSFSYDSIFRISGDEFVVIVPKLQPDSFGSRTEKLRADLEAAGDLASLGAASGSGAERMDLLKTAEERMYEDKRRNYEKHPEYVR